MNPRSQWARFAVALAAVGVTVFVIVEVSLRLILGDLYTTLYRPDAQAHYRLAPGSRKVFQHPPADGGTRIAVRVNQAGFRGEELLATGATRRVLVYGDSFVAAEFSALEHTFSEQLERHLERDRQEPVEVVNAGVVGYGPDQVLLRMQGELSALEPDLVILAVYAGNDFGDLLRNKLFVRGAAGDLVENAPQLARSIERRLRWSRYAPVLYKVLARAYYNWTHRPPADAAPADARARQVDSWLDTRRAEWKSASAHDPVVTNLLRDTPDLDISTAPGSEAARYKLALMELVLTAIRDTAARTRVPLLLLIIPNPMDVCEGYPLAHVDPATFPDYRPEQATAQLSQMAERLNVPQLDLFAEFAAKDPCRLFFSADPHWNDAGQKLAAQLTADTIARHRLIR